jgi:hypothetical protein
VAQEAQRDRGAVVAALGAEPAVVLLDAVGGAAEDAVHRTRSPLMWTCTERPDGDSVTSTRVRLGPVPASMMATS